MKRRNRRNLPGGIASRMLGVVAERSFRFWDAARWYREAAYREVGDGRAGLTDEQIDVAALLLMRSARALQKAENWRTQAASWEMLGNRLGAQLPSDVGADERRARYVVPADRKSVAGFYVISEQEWTTPPGQDYDDAAAIQRHHQAQAYQWAAECAQADLQFSEAARLFRKAGVAWQASERKQKDRRAADCYWQAALSAAQSSRFATRSMIRSRHWCPSCLRDKSSEDGCQCRDHDRPDLKHDGEGSGSDLERLRQCWNSYLKSFGVSSTARPDQKRELRDGFTTACAQIAGIQRQLAIGGARDDALKAYRFRMVYVRAFYKDHQRLRYLRSSLSRIISHNFSSVWYWLGFVVFAYAVAIPALWWISGAVHEASSGRGGPAEAVVFSLTNAADFTPGHFKAGNTLTTALQALQALSGYFALGVALWIGQRSYDS